MDTLDLMMAAASGFVIGGGLSFNIWMNTWFRGELRGGAGVGDGWPHRAGAGAEARYKAPEHQTEIGIGSRSVQFGRDEGLPLIFTNRTLLPSTRAAMRKGSE